MGEDTITITLPTSHRGLDSEEFRLGEAISLTQTQDAFLGRVQEALQRMSELSKLAQTPAQNEEDRSGYAAEFVQLQQRVQELGKKMHDAARTFQSLRLDLSGDEEASSFAAAVASLVSESIAAPSNLGLADLATPERASAAGATIHKTLETMADLRGKVEVNLQRLNATSLQISRASNLAVPANAPQTTFTHASTRSICNEILVKSGTAMLAQANAIPESALQLLR